MPILLNDLRTGVHRTSFDIDQAEYEAIGRVTVQWAYLEHGVFAVTQSLASKAGIGLPSDALSTSFKRRLTAFRLTVEEVAAEPDRTRLLKLISQIANAEPDRHRITHGMWEWDRDNPDRISSSSFRPGFEFEKTFDAERINKLADKIGEITAALEYPEGLKSFFDGYTDENGHVSYAGISRQRHREMTSRKIQAPKGIGKAKPPLD
jgi:hypothetical protein